MVFTRRFGDYQIGSDGTIYSLIRRRYLKPSRQAMKNKMGEQYFTGYLCTTLFVDGSFKRLYIHRLVAQLFIDNPENKPWVNHKDGNKSNNDVSNLEWSTISENLMHAIHVLGKKKLGRPRVHNTRIN